MGAPRSEASRTSRTGTQTATAEISACDDDGSASPETVASPSESARAAYARLVSGNQRFSSRTTAAASPADVEEMFRRNAAGQAPYATILTCSDSRLGPNMIFDELLGELFVVREAGNIAAAPTSLGSLEFARLVLGTSLLVVMGHEGCGAVRAALEESEVPGNVKAVVEAIQPGIAGASGLDDAVAKNVRAVIASIRANSPALADAAVVGAVYRLASGEVHFLDPAPRD